MGILTEQHFLFFARFELMLKWVHVLGGNCDIYQSAC